MDIFCELSVTVSVLCLFKQNFVTKIMTESIHVKTSFLCSHCRFAFIDEDTSFHLKIMLSYKVEFP